jgi:hypothetical protein
MELGTMAQAYNFSYSGGRDWEIFGFAQARVGKKFARSHLNQ